MPPQMNTGPRASTLAIASVALFMLLCAVILAATAPLVGKDPGAANQLLIGLITSATTLGLTQLFRRLAGRTHADIGLNTDRRTPFLFVVGLAAGLAIAGLWALLCILTGLIKWRMTSQSDLSSTAVWLATYLFLAIREELAFHAYPLWRLRDCIGLWPAQFAIAIVFALEHRLGGMTWTQAFLGAGVGSILFGMASFTGRGIALAIGMHASWNFAHRFLGMKNEPGVWAPAINPGDEQHADIAAMAAYILVFAVAITVLAWLERRNRHTQRS